jgi:hypothetical protein
MLDQLTEAPPDDEAGPGRWSSFRSQITAAEIAVVVAFFVPLAVWAWRVVGFGNRFQYWSDNANNELSSLDVGSHFVAIGSYSRKVWSHPGPFGFYLLALPAHLSRQNSLGLALGVLAVNAAAIAGILVCARRRGGTPLLAVTAALLAVLLHGLGPAYLVDVWHPSLPLLPFVLLLFLCWNISLGERWSLPIAVVIACFCLQEHVGYAVVATVPVLLAAVVGLGSIWRSPADERRGQLRTWVRPTVLALVVGLLLWTPPIIEEVRGDPGNFTLLAEYFSDSDGEEPAGLEYGWERQLTALDLQPSWAIGEPPPQLVFRSGWQTLPDIPVTLLALAAGLVLAILRRDRQGVIGGAMAAATVAVGVFSAARVTGFPYFYLTRWSIAVGWFATLMAAWLLVSALVEWRPTARRLVAPTALALLAVMSVLFTSNVVHERNPQDPWGPINQQLAAQAKDALPPGPGPVQFLANYSYQAMAHRSALVTSFERSGIATEVQNGNPITHGIWRTGLAPNPRVTLMVAADEQIEEFAELPGYRKIAEVRPQTAEEARRADEYLADIEDRIDRGDYPSWKELDRAAVLGEVHALAVFEVDQAG